MFIRFVAQRHRCVIASHEIALFRMMEANRKNGDTAPTFIPIIAQA